MSVLLKMPMPSEELVCWLWCDARLLTCCCFYTLTVWLGNIITAEEKSTNSSKESGSGFLFELDCVCDNNRFEPVWLFSGATEISSEEASQHSRLPHSSFHFCEQGLKHWFFIRSELFLTYTCKHLKFPSFEDYNYVY